MSDHTLIHELATRYGKGGDPSTYKMMLIAIEAERERCAKIAESYWPGATDDSITGEARRDIAAAIRSQKNG